MRVGIGYDVHPLVNDRKLVLGGVEIKHGKGLGGWSDADVLTHAVMEALLGAAALGDIGYHFPSGESSFKDISSLHLLDIVMGKLEDEGFRVINVDVTVVAENPRLREYIETMRRNIAKVLQIDIENVSIKASTNNGLGSLGAGEGIAAHAVALIDED